MLVNLEGHGREENAVPGADLSRTVGWFTTLFPVRIDLTGLDVVDALAGGSTAASAVKLVKETLLGLPDNGSYKNYAELKRKYVMWNVIATPELSMTPQQWCFPVAGCVDYRGYYSKDAADAFASALRRQGFDVRVSGVPAYSTLGWFNDPVLSTFIELPEAEVARMVFHELAHQVAYAPGDSQFNESFATTVEEIGVARWLQAQGSARTREDYRVYHQRKEDFLGLLAFYRHQLEDNYARAVPDAEKRERKGQLTEALRQDYEAMKAERWGGYAGYDRWFDSPLSNAHFVLVATYHDLVPAFHALHAEHVDFGRFYREVRQLAKLQKTERRLRLARYLPPSGPATGSPSSAATVASQ